MKKTAKITDIEKAINRLNFLEMPYTYREGKIIVEVVSDINYDSIRVIVSDESILKLAKEWSK
jgi:nitrate reductase NapAB chaperone NapD